MRRRKQATTAESRQWTAIITFDAARPEATSLQVLGNVQVQAEDVPTALLQLRDGLLVQIGAQQATQAMQVARENTEEAL